MNRIIVTALLAVSLVACTPPTTNEASPSTAVVATPGTTEAPTPEPTEALPTASPVPGDILSFREAVAAGDCDTIVSLDIDPDRLTMAELDAAVEALDGCLAELAKPVTVKGKNSQNSKPFELSGDYDVVVVGKGADRDNVIVELYDRDDSDFWELLVNEITRKGSYRYETTLYGIDSGEYYLDTTMPEGSWTVTFTPMQ